MPIGTGMHRLFTQVKPWVQSLSPQHPGGIALGSTQVVAQSTCPGEQEQTLPPVVAMHR